VHDVVEPVGHSAEPKALNGCHFTDENDVGTSS
jgi:hypothetical protein